MVPVPPAGVAAEALPVAAVGPFVVAAAVVADDAAAIFASGRFAAAAEGPFAGG